LNAALKGEKDGVMFTKPGHLMIGNTYGQMIMLHVVPNIRVGLCLDITQGSL